MTERKVLMCDCCNERLANNKCNVCGSDLCRICGKTFSEDLKANYGSDDYERYNHGNNLFQLPIVNVKKDSTEIFIICNKCITEYKKMFTDLGKMKVEDQTIFFKDLMGFIKFRLPPIITAHKI
jgi:hypothetical protein